MGLPPVRSCSTWLEAEPVALPSATQHRPDRPLTTKDSRWLVKALRARKTAGLELLQESEALDNKLTPQLAGGLQGPLNAFKALCQLQLPAVGPT